MVRILILDQDRQLSTQIYETLANTGEHEIMTTVDLREACLIVSQQPQDIAFISQEGSETFIQSLRSLQPDLRIILIADQYGRAIPPAIRSQVQGVLPRNHGAALGKLFVAALSRPVAQTAPANGSAGHPPASRAALTATLQNAIQEEQILAALLSEKTGILTHAGTLDAGQMRYLARRVWQTWQAAGAGKVLVTFSTLPGRVSEVLLFVRMINRQRLLTLIARPDTTITPLRRMAESLITALAAYIPTEDSRPSVADPITIMEPEAATRINSFVLVWRSVEPIPQVLHIPIKRALARIAQTNACLLTYQEVQPTHIHLVVTCPPGRDSSWAAHRFKMGTSQEIQAQFGIQANLWLPGYVAIASTEPLNAQDLDLFLSWPAIKESQ